MTEAEKATLQEIADCSGMVHDDQYTPAERVHLKELEKQGLVTRAWVLTQKGKLEVKTS